MHIKVLSCPWFYPESPDFLSIVNESNGKRINCFSVMDWIGKGQGSAYTSSMKN